jgi:hypothetical protein
MLAALLPAAGADSGEFSALTYNVAGLPDGITGSPDPLARMPRIARLLNDYDLVLLQEDWRTPDPNPAAPMRVYHEVLEAVAAHPFRSIPAPIPFGHDPSRPSAYMSDGLNEFSRVSFDPKTVRHVPWKTCYGDVGTGAGDCLALKGFTVTVHRFAPGVDVDVYNLHGEAGQASLDREAARRGFEAELAPFVKAHSDGHAVLLGGDTNLKTGRSPDAEIWRAFLAATGMRDVCDTVDCGTDRHGIDKFAYRSGANVVLEPVGYEVPREKFRYPGGRLSDHDPVAVRFRWSKGS